MKHEKDVNEELGKLPRTLIESYDAIFQRIKDAASTSQLVAESTMKWLLCAQRPLNTAEFIAAISITSDGQYIPLAIPQLLNICCNMVVLDEEIDIFRFAHLSVREYFESKSGYTAIETHSLALDRCIETYTYELQPQQESATIQNDIFRPYATIYWPVHFQVVDSGQLAERLEEKLKRFLFQGYGAAPSFAKWASAAKELSKSLPYDHPQQDILRDASQPSTPFPLACCFGLVWILYELKIFENCWNEQNEYGSPGLNLAAKWGCYSIIKLLLEHKADVEAKGAGAETPLHRASSRGHADVVKLLLEHKADVEAKDAYEETPLYWASYQGHADVVKLLLEHKADVEAKGDNRDTPLHRASYQGHANVVKLLLEHKADVEAKDDGGETPLHRASSQGHADVVKLLLEHKADVEAKDDGGETPLYRASYQGHADVVKLLLEHKANVEAKGACGDTPLYRASSRGHADVVKLLLEHKANVEAKDADRETPLYRALADGNINIL
jgi:ankyrin repeat protein